MNEAEWLACTDPQKMLSFLEAQKPANVRKAHLFACVCVRRIWQLLTDDRIRLAVEMGEQLADGAIAAEYIDDAWCAWVQDDPDFFSGEYAEVAALAATGVSARWDFDDAQKYAVCAATGVDPSGIDPVNPRVAVELKVQEQLLRCIGGNPFRPGHLDPSSLTPTLEALAQTAYQERELPSGYLDETHLFLLADALEEAGCSDTDLLGHLRGPGPHARGCWAVDLVLAKG
jgi:hypothetical protein